MNLKDNHSKIQEFKTAVFRNNIPVIEQLIKADRSLANFIDEEHWHILSTAVFYSSSSSVSTLIGNGSDVRIAYYRSKEDPLILAITRLGMTRESNDSKKTFDIILNAYKKANINIYSPVNELLLTYLSHACQVNSLYALQNLQSYFFNEESKSVFYLLTENNPFFIALQNKNSQVLKYLLNTFRESFGYSILTDERIFKEMLIYLRDKDCYIELLKEIRFHTSYSEEKKRELIDLASDVLNNYIRWYNDNESLIKAITRISY